MGRIAGNRNGKGLRWSLFLYILLGAKMNHMAKRNLRNEIILKDMKD